MWQNLSVWAPVKVAGHETISDISVRQYAAGARDYHIQSVAANNDERPL